MRLWLKALSPLYSPFPRNIVFACIFGSILLSPVSGRWTSFLSKLAADPAKFCRTALDQWSERNVKSRWFSQNCDKAEMDDAPLPQRAQFKKRNRGKDSSSTKEGGCDAHSKRCDTDPPKSHDLKDDAYLSHGCADVQPSSPGVLLDAIHSTTAPHRPCSPSSTAHTRFLLTSHSALFSSLSQCNGLHPAF
jgi:hypothetical protein